jgi:hypothetical protein
MAKADAIWPTPWMSAPAATHDTSTTTDTFHEPAAQNPIANSARPTISSTHHPGALLAANAIAMSKDPRKMK